MCSVPVCWCYSDAQNEDGTYWYVCNLLSVVRREFIASDCDDVELAYNVDAMFVHTLDDHIIVSFHTSYDECLIGS